MLDKKLYMLAMILLVIGAVNWLLVGAVNFNLVEAAFGRGALTRTIYVVVGLAAAYVLWRRDFYLPFLGDTALPCAAVEDRIPPGATHTVKVVTAPGKKILYWAAEPAMDDLKAVRDWRTAYVKFENAGVATAGADGMAYLKVRNPQAYTVPMIGGLYNKKINPHVHYRICGEDGILSRVNTVMIATGDVVEGFQAEEAAAAAEVISSVEGVPVIPTSTVIDLDSIGMGDILSVLKSLEEGAGRVVATKGRTEKQTEKEE